MDLAKQADDLQSISDQGHAWLLNDGSESKHNARDSDFPAQDELDDALAHFDTGRVGAPESYRTPFTRQLKDDTAARFDVDKHYFDRADRVQREVIASYFGLRLFTLFLFLVLLIIQVSVFAAMFVSGDLIEPGEWQSNLHTVKISKNIIGALSSNDSSQLVSGAAIVVVLGAIFFGVRLIVRGVSFYVLKRRSQELSFLIFTRLDDINTRVTEVCAKVRDRIGKGGDWPARARNWTIIALWHAKRGEYLDRYITTVIWKVRTSIQETENFFFWIIKIAASVAAVGLAGSVTQSASVLIIFGIFVFAQSFLPWHYWGMQPADFWEKQFRHSASDDDGAKENYAHKIATVVENLVDEVIAKEFGQGGARGQ